LKKLEEVGNWPSFEKFRTEGSKALEEIENGVVGTLMTKTGQYRIVEEKDFQKMYGLAREVERLRGGWRMVAVAVRAAQKHPDPETLAVLAEAVALLGNLPELPTRDSFAGLEPEGIPLEEEDEVTLDPKEILRPFAANLREGEGR
jgi:hypothetical protein